MPSAPTPTEPARPRIGLSAYRQTTSWWSWERDAALVPGHYLDRVREAGGQPLIIPPADRGSAGTAADIATLVDVLDGLVVIGGGDVAADRYGQVPDPRAGGTNPQRDQLELDLLAAALQRDLPVLAICRGLQVLNVLQGGDLTQYLPDVVGSVAHQPRPGAFGPVEVWAEPGSAVAGILGERFEVLCSHHQAVRTVGRGLTVTATSADGVIEAIELDGARFVVGVQWHPEESGDGRLFEALVASTRTREPA
jgi:putative glutamine amidotransferase